MGSVDAHTEEARVVANTGLAHWAATKRALQHTLLAHAAYVSRAPRQAAHWRADTDVASNIAEIRQAIFGLAFPIDGGTTPLIFKLPLEVAMSQPAPGTPIGRQSSSYSATPLTNPTHVSHSQRSAAHRRPIQMQWQHGCGLACYIRAPIPHHQERPHCTDAWQQGGITASQPHLSPLLAIPPPCFSSIAVAIATTCKQHDCHHHHHHHH